MVNAEAVPVPSINLASVDIAMKSTNDKPKDGGDVEKFEYEFSNCYHGRISFITLWDTTDLSACERLTHRPLKIEDIIYSSTGNGFVTDNYGLEYTFTKQPYKSSYVLPEMGVGTTDEIPVGERRKIHKRTREVSTDDALALLLSKVEPTKTLNIGDLNLNQL